MGELDTMNWDPELLGRREILIEKESQWRLSVYAAVASLRRRNSKEMASSTVSGATKPL
jgi:hypothetical protein